MMGRLATLSLSMVLLLAAYPLISIGLMPGRPDYLWRAGLVLLVVGGAIPPVRRFLSRREPPQPPSDVGMADDQRA